MRLTDLFEDQVPASGAADANAKLMKMISKNLIGALNFADQMVLKGIPLTHASMVALVTAHPLAIENLPDASEDIQELAVAQYPNAIRGIERPSRRVQAAALEHDARSLAYIKHQDPDLMRKAVEEVPDLIRFAQNPPEDLVLMAVEREPWTVEHLKSPTEAVLAVAAPLVKHPAQFVRTCQQNEWPLTDKVALAIMTNPRAFELIQAVAELPVDLQQAAFDANPKNYHSLRYLKNFDPSIEAKWQRHIRRDDRKFNLPLMARRPGAFAYNADQLKLVRWMEQNDVDSISVKQLKQQPWGNTPYFADLVKRTGVKDITKAMLEASPRNMLSQGTQDLIGEAKISVVNWDGGQRLFDKEQNRAAVFHVKGAVLRPFLKTEEDEHRMELVRSNNHGGHPGPPSARRHSSGIVPDFGLDIDHSERRKLKDDKDYTLGWVRFTRFGADIWIDEVQSDLFRLLSSEASGAFKDLQEGILLEFLRRMRRRGAERFLMPTYDMKVDLYHADPPKSVYTDLPRKLRFRLDHDVTVGPHEFSDAWVLEGAGHRLR